MQWWQLLILEIDLYKFTQLKCILYCISDYLEFVKFCSPPIIIGFCDLEKSSTDHFIPPITWSIKVCYLFYYPIFLNFVSTSSYFTLTMFWQKWKLIFLTIKKSLVDIYLFLFGNLGLYLYYVCLCLSLFTCWVIFFNFLALNILLQHVT